MLANDKKIIISTGTSRKAVSWVEEELLWSDFVARLQRPIRTRETFREYLSLSKARQDDLKDVGGYVGGTLKNGLRRNGHAGERHLITLDADNVPAGGTQMVINAIDGLGCAYALYSTRKHEGGAPRFRIIVPLDTPAAPDEYEPIARKLANYIGMSLFDPTTFQPVRLMYWPSCSADGEYVFQFGDKGFLSRAGMLGQYADWRNVLEWPEIPGAQKLQIKRAKKQGDPLEKQGVVGAFCKVYDVPGAIDEFLQGTYESCSGYPDRYSYLEGSTSGGAILYDDGKFIFSHHATDPAGGKLCNAFDLVRLHLFGDLDDDAKPETPVTGLPSFKAMCEHAVALPEVSQLLNAERYQKAQEAFGKPLEDSSDLAWMDRMQCSSRTGLPEKTIDNVLIVLQNDPQLSGRFYHDEYSNRAMICAPMPWEAPAYPYKERPWMDVDDAGLRHYMESVYSITGEKKILDAMALSAMTNKKHKIKDYLESLIWDGVPRLDGLLIDYFGAADSMYTRLAIRKTITAAVARIFQPGVKFDTMLVLSGSQGTGKSTFFSFLGKDWYSDSLETFEGKEAAELLQGYWIIEAGELTGMNKTETNAVKQFLSKKEDIYRVPYGKHTAPFPRRCVIVGTTNNAEFLRDVTGNRRFWPVSLEQVPPRKNIWRDLPGEVDQIWAEAVSRHRAGEPLYLQDEAAEEAKAAQEAHKEVNPKEGIIQEFLERKIPSDWSSRDLYARRAFWGSDFKSAEESLLRVRERVCAAEIWCECFQGDLKLMRRADTVEINGILNNMDTWVKASSALKFGKFYGAQKGYIRKESEIDKKATEIIFSR